MHYYEGAEHSLHQFEPKVQMLRLHMSVTRNYNIPVAVWWKLILYWIMPTIVRYFVDHRDHIYTQIFAVTFAKKCLYYSRSYHCHSVHFPIDVCAQIKLYHNWVCEFVISASCDKCNLSRIIFTQKIILFDDNAQFMLGLSYICTDWIKESDIFFCFWNIMSWRWNIKDKTWQIWGIW